MNMSKLQLVSRIKDKLNLTKNQVILLIKYNSAKEIEEIYTALSLIKKSNILFNNFSINMLSEYNIRKSEEREGK